MSRDEVLFRSFREKGIDTPLWSILWPTSFGSVDTTFEDRLNTVLPTAEAKMRVIDYFQGDRWEYMELPQDVHNVFNFLMLDYRSVPCFVNSAQVARYVKQEYEECFGMIASELDLSPSKNNSNFVWSDPVAKAADVIRLWGEKTPVGADAVLYLMYCEYSHGEDNIFTDFLTGCVCPPLSMVYFHGEESKEYTHVGEDCTLLEYMLFFGNASFDEYCWSEPVVERAMGFVEELIQLDETGGDSGWNISPEVHLKARRLLLSAREVIANS